MWFQFLVSFFANGSLFSLSMILSTRFSFEVDNNCLYILWSLISVISCKLIFIMKTKRLKYYHIDIKIIVVDRLSVKTLNIRNSCLERRYFDYAILTNDDCLQQLNINQLTIQTHDITTFTKHSYLVFFCT